MPAKQLPIRVDRIEKAILLVRGQKVMLDRVLAELYDVETGALNRQSSVIFNVFQRILCFRLLMRRRNV
jgi:hypothetical protein